MVNRIHIRVGSVRLRHRQQAQHHLERSHIVFQCMITALIGLVQMKYQSTELTPFDTHPVNMLVFLAAVCSFGLGLSIERRFQNQFIKGVNITSIVLSSISLAAIFLPHLLARICLGLSIVCPVALGRHYIKQIYDCLKRDIKEKSLLARDKFKRFSGYLTRENQQLPREPLNNSLAALPGESFFFKYRIYVVASCSFVVVKYVFLFKKSINCQDVKQQG